MPFEPPQRLVLAEHGLAEQVEVELRAALADRRDRGAELVRPRVDDEVADHLAQHPTGDGHDGRRQHRRNRSAEPDGTAQVPREEPGHQRSDTAQIGRRRRQALGAHHAVDEADREGQPVRVFENAGQSLGSGVHVDLGALGDPPLRQRHSTRGEVVAGCCEVGVPLIRVGHHATSLKAARPARPRRRAVGCLAGQTGATQVT